MLNMLKTNDKTVIVIAHRLSTVANSDKIIVLKEGQVVEEGVHTELLEMDNHYAYALETAVPDTGQGS